MIRGSTDLRQSSSWADFRKWWTLKEGDSPTIDFYDQHPLIGPASHISNVAMLVIDIKTMSYSYISPNFDTILGDINAYKKGGVQHAFSQVALADRTGVTIFSELINAYFLKLPNDEKLHYRTYWDFRVADKTGEYVKVLQQDCALKYDERGGIEELLLCVSRIENVISPDVQHLRLTNGKESHFYKYDHKLETNFKLPLLSNREIEIAKLIAKSLSLKEVASELKISFHTVKAHSANMLEKLRVSDSLEMINLLRLWNFI